MRLSTAANKKFQQWLYFLYYPSLGFFIERCTYRILTLKCLELTLYFCCNQLSFFVGDSVVYNLERFVLRSKVPLKGGGFRGGVTHLSLSAIKKGVISITPFL